jgi:stage II sporulation protein AB (anti-sigma F factor)
MATLSPRTLTRVYASQPEAVAGAREAMAAFALESGASSEQADQVRLAVSETVTNAILHGYRDRSGDVHVHASVTGGALTIVVRDEGVGMQPHLSCPGLGLGLGIVARVTDQMAIVPRPQGGVELQMRFALVARGAPTAPPAPRRAVYAADA